MKPSGFTLIESLGGCDSLENVLKYSSFHALKKLFQHIILQLILYGSHILFFTSQPTLFIYLLISLSLSLSVKPTIPRRWSNLLISLVDSIQWSSLVIQSSVLIKWSSEEKSMREREEKVREAGRGERSRDLRESM